MHMYKYLPYPLLPFDNLDVHKSASPPPFLYIYYFFSLSPTNK